MVFTVCPRLTRSLDSPSREKTPLDSCHSESFSCCDRSLWPKATWGAKGYHLRDGTTSSQGSQGRNSNRNREAGAGAEAMVTCFSCSLQDQWPRGDPCTLAGPLIRKMPTGLPTGLSSGGIVPIESLSPRITLACVKSTSCLLTSIYTHDTW